MLSSSNQPSLAKSIISFDACIPTDPYTAHSNRSGLSFDEILKQKQLHTEYISDFVTTLPPGLDQMLGLVGVELMQQFHFNQFRSGIPLRHYTHHTSHVGVRAAQAAEQYLHTLSGVPMNFSQWETHLGKKISPVTIVLLLGLLHDSREDFWCNFENTPCLMTRDEGALLVDQHIIKTLAPLIGEDCSKEIIKRITWLSIENEDEFPTQLYVEKILDDFFCSCVKRADYSHNLKTFPDFTPTYPLMIVPAQYWRLMEDPLFKVEYLEGIIFNLVRFDPTETVPWDKELRERKVRTSDYLIEMFAKYQEPEAITRIHSFYTSLDLAVRMGEFAAFLKANHLSSGVISDKIRGVLGTLKGS